MAWFSTHDLDEFAAAAGDYLRARPVDNTLLLTIIDNLGVRGERTYGGTPPRFGWWRPADGPVDGAFLHTPPYPVVVTDLPPEAVAPLVQTLAGVDRLNVVSGVAEVVEAEWSRRTGVAATLLRRTRLYRLGELTPSDPAPSGRARTAKAGDRDLLLSWFETFATELGEVDENVADVVDDRIGYGGLTIWEDGGEPVSMAGRTRPVAGMVRVAPVYTPVELRRRGYAGAATAAVSRAARDLADEVLLFTDVANTTSNALYQRLGYRPVHDRLVLSSGGG